MRINISWAFAGNAGYAACQWMVFVLLLRALPLEAVGEFAYWVAVTGPLFVLANVRLRNLAATDVEATHPFADFLRARLLTTAAALGVALLVGTILAPRAGSMTVLSLLLIARGCDALSDICHGFCQRELDLRSAAIGLLMNGGLSVLFVGAALAVAPTLAGATAAYAAGSLLTLLGWDLPRVRRLTAPGEGPGRAVSGSLRPALGLLRRALPLGLSSAIGSLQANLPRYVVAAVLGHAPLAVFTALAYIPTLGNLVVNAVAQASLPMLARDLRESATRYRRRLRGLVQAGATLGALSVLATLVAGPPVLEFLYGPAVAAGFDVLLWLMVAAAISYGFLFLGTAATARRRFGSQLLISTGGLLTVAFAILPLVSRFGMAGAAYALCAGATLEACAYGALTWHDLRDGARAEAAVAGLVAAADGARHG